MSFYRRAPPQMGFVWLAPVIQFVADAAKSHPVGTIHEEAPSTPWLGIAAGVGGVLVLGGLAYALVNSKKAA